MVNVSIPRRVQKRAARRKVAGRSAARKAFGLAAGRVRRHHEVVLRGARFAGAGAEPAILERTDSDPVTVMLAKLVSENGRRNLAASRAATGGSGGVLKLFQPVHRIFHLALTEVHCRQPGEPRLDPERIESAGLVIRRLGAGGTVEGWCEADGSVRGWVPLGRQESREDPDPKRRPSPLRAGHPQIDRRLAALAGGQTPLAERTSPLFVAPPEVCKAAGRTLLYGVVPLASAELSEAPSPAPRPSDAELDEHLSPILSNRRTRSQSSIDYRWLGRKFEPEEKDKEHFAPLAKLLGQLTVELDAFGRGSGAKALVRLLDRIHLTYDDGTRRAGRVLKQAAEVQFEGTGGVLMPNRWPAIPHSLRRQIRRQIRQLFEARLAAIVPGEGRYADLDARYRVSAFVRVRRDDGCPPDLVWSAASAPFTIAAWYESGGAPPVKIALPDVTDRKVLEKLKPDVTFDVPPKLKALLDGVSLEGLLEGKKGDGSGLGIGWTWLCSFSIPIITLCAFLVLSIFLALLNFIFFWLPFVRICLPIPVPKKE